jgi:hypothetical protein
MDSVASTDELLIQTVLEVFARNPSARITDIEQAWRAKRGGSITDDEGARLWELYEAHKGSAQAGTWRHRRPTWLAIALTFVGLGFYQIVWLGVTWAEMKRELDDSDMHPWWHAAAYFVPFYNWWILYQHFGRIQDLGTRIDKGLMISPGWSLTMVIVASLLSTAYTQIGVGFSKLIVHALWLGLLALVVANGQNSLNEYWDGASGRAVPTRIHWAEWTVLGLGVLLGIVVVVTDLMPIAR